MLGHLSPRKSASSKLKTEVFFTIKLSMKVLFKKSCCPWKNAKCLIEHWQDHNNETNSDITVTL